MTIKDILEYIDIKKLYIPDSIKKRKILSLCHDSRMACPTCVFFCKAGALTDGHRYARQAYANGARIFVAEKELELPEDAAVIITQSSQNALNALSVMFYGDPSKNLRIIGITGTKGKTTVALSAYYIALSRGMNVGYIGTNGIYYNGKVFETSNTTPDVLELQKAFRKMADHGVEAVMLEVSSQALWQERTYGIEFETCVFTNLYNDHIGGYEHPSFEHYRDSKKKLFTDYKVKNIIINSDSTASEYMLDGVECQNIITTSAMGNEKCSLYAKNAMKIKNGIIPGISYACYVEKALYKCIDGFYDVFMPAPGLYSVQNGLLVTAICLTLGIELDFIIKALSCMSVPGRFETVTLECRPNSLFVIDYAHNGASLKAVLSALREYDPKRIICLFGSVGGRTFGRRAELGEVARDNADVIIVTSDNPNNEHPMSVINDINSAIGESDKPVYLIPDRQEAIEKAVEIAQDGDYILLAGKGHEAYQLIQGERVPFSERNILKLADKIYTEC